MGTRGEGLGEGQPCAMLVHQPGQCLGAGHALALQCRGEVDGLGVLVQAHEHRHVPGRAAAHAQLYGIDQPVQAVGSVQLAPGQLVAQAGPGGLAVQVEGQALLLGEALGGGHDHRGAVGQGHETDVQAGLLGASLPLTQARGIVGRAVFTGILGGRRSCVGQKKQPMCQGPVAMAARWL